MVNKKRVPDRWKDYKPCSWTPIENERIIPFKTPLAKKFVTQMEGDEGLIHSERFTPSDFMSELEERGLHLGMVLDFTFTKRYYDPKEFTDKEIIYKKMMCPGHEIPKEQDVKRFEFEVYSFLEKNKTGALVGVHCTHGLNRTGYMVCRYLIDCKGYKPEDAIKAFNDARGYPIERENYLEDLESREPSHDVDFEEYCKEMPVDDQSTSNFQGGDSKEKRKFEFRERASDYDQYSGQGNYKKRKFPREDSWTDNYEQDFTYNNYYERHAQNDRYQGTRHSDRYNNQELYSYPRLSSHSRSYWNHNYDRNPRSHNSYDRRMDYTRRHDRYYSRYQDYGNGDSELDWYERDYNWQRNQSNFGPAKHKHRYK